MIKIDPQVYKLKDRRIKAVQNSSMSLQSLILTIRPGDYIIYLNNTVYALTESQYYAALPILMPDLLNKDSFYSILKDIPNELQQNDKIQLQKIKDQKIGCSSCKYNTYKFKVMDILRKYPQIYNKYVQINQRNIVQPYPKVSQPVVAKVGKMFPKFFQVPSYQRKSCLDCVTKHVCMAYIKGNQAQQGYPQHLALCLANLQEAYEQTPKDCIELKQLLLFCIAKTKKQNKAFIPWKNILYVVDLSRQFTKDKDANNSNQVDSSFDLELNEQIKAQLYSIPVTQKALLIKQIDQLIRIQYNKEGKQLVTLYTGLSGSVADLILPYSAAASNILRNRRIMFRAAPQLVRDTQYDCKDFRQAIVKKTN